MSVVRESVASLRVRQAALNAVHPQLSVLAVLSTEVIHSFGRLELKDAEGNENKPSDKCTTTDACRPG